MHYSTAILLVLVVLIVNASNSVSSFLGQETTTTTTTTTSDDDAAAVLGLSDLSPQEDLSKGIFVPKTYADQFDDAIVLLDDLNNVYDHDDIANGDVNMGERVLRGKRKRRHVLKMKHWCRQELQETMNVGIDSYKHVQGGGQGYFYRRMEVLEDDIDLDVRYITFYHYLINTHSYFVNSTRFY